VGQRGPWARGGVEGWPRGTLLDTWGHLLYARLFVAPGGCLGRGGDLLRGCGARGAPRKRARCGRRGFRSVGSCFSPFFRFLGGAGVLVGTTEDGKWGIGGLAEVCKVNRP